jgi:thiol-disulfide isomerase/thioredoxin
LRRLHRKKLAFVLTACVIAAGCSRQPAGRGGWALENNQRAALSDYKGKVVVLDFYATWCEPCRAETPHLVRLQNEFGPRGFQVIGLNVGGDEDRDKVPAYAKEFNIQYPLAYPDDDLVTKYLSDNENIPQSFVFDRNGNLLRRFVGYSSRSAVELDTVIKTAVESAPR